MPIYADCDKCKHSFDGDVIYCPDCYTELEAEINKLNDTIGDLEDQIKELENRKE